VDRHAVDHPRRERLELAAHGGGSRLVEERETFVHLARHDEHRPFEHHRHRFEIAITEARRQLVRARQVFLGRLELPHHHGSRSACEREMTVLDAFRLVREQPRSA
jgi:hypothetical protein